jgi:hypothetical protein
MEGRRDGRAGVVRSAMPEDHVFFIGNIRRQVEAAAEPPHVTGGEEAHVHVRGGCMGVHGMHHHRDAHGAEAAAGEVRVARRGGWRKLRSADVGKRHAGAFHYRPAFLNGGHAAALQLALACGALPGITQELATEVVAEGAAEVVLQRMQPGKDLCGALFFEAHARHCTLRLS